MVSTLVNAQTSTRAYEYNAHRPKFYEYDRNDGTIFISARGYVFMWVSWINWRGSMVPKFEECVQRNVTGVSQFPQKGIFKHVKLSYTYPFIFDKMSNNTWNVFLTMWSSLSPGVCRLTSKKTQRRCIITHSCEESYGHRWILITQLRGSGSKSKSKIFCFHNKRNIVHTRWRLRLCSVYVSRHLTRTWQYTPLSKLG